MEGFFNVLVFFSGLIILVYVIWMIKWTLSWKNYTGRKITLNSSNKVKVSIIVAVRNEEKNIPELIKSLLNQNYPADLFEILISDDFSTDDTVKMIMDFITAHPEKKTVLKLVSSNSSDTEGKKSALERAIKIATGDLIMTTDADCIASPGWVKSFADVYAGTGAKMITGFVMIHPCRNFASKLQALDILSLSGTGAVSVINDKPLMCNGANLAFSKNAFYENDGYAYGKDQPTGDDTFLMLKIAKSGKGSVLFNSSPESFIQTTPANSFDAFISQRIRWASKVKYYSESYIKLTGLFIFLVNLMLLLLIVSAIAGLISWKILLGLWLIKAASDLLILAVISIFTKQQKLLFVFLPAQLIYPFYSVVGGLVASLKSEYEWKGRKY